MQIITELSELRATVAAWRLAGLKVAFVPTMGNLHAGHFKLVTAAREHADKVIVSIFVNPMQFGPTEDLASYPRTLADDCAGLTAHQADAVFTPSAELMYPHGLAPTNRGGSTGHWRSALWCRPARPFPRCARQWSANCLICYNRMWRCLAKKIISNWR